MMCRLELMVLGRDLAPGKCCHPSRVSGTDYVLGNHLIDGWPKSPQIWASIKTSETRGELTELHVGSLETVMRQDDEI